MLDACCRKMTECKSSLITLALSNPSLQCSASIYIAKLCQSIFQRQIALYSPCCRRRSSSRFVTINSTSIKPSMKVRSLTFVLYTQCIISASSVHYQCIIRASSGHHHQGTISTSSVHYQRIYHQQEHIVSASSIISASLLHHHCIISAAPAQHERIMSASSAHHQRIISVSSAHHDRLIRRPLKCPKGHSYIRVLHCLFCLVHSYAHHFHTWSGVVHSYDYQFIAWRVMLSDHEQLLFMRFIYEN